MASEFPGQHASASTPVATRQESSVEPSLPDSSNTVGPRQDAVASYTTTQIGGSASYPQIFPSQSGEGSAQQPEIRVAQPSPSDLERGMGDLPSDAHSPEGADFPFVPLRQPASILLPPESVPVVYGGASSGYDGFPAEGRYPHMRRQGHFSSSQDGSPPRQLHPTLPRVGSQSKSHVERFSSSGSPRRLRQDSGMTLSDGHRPRSHHTVWKDHASSFGHSAASAQQGNDQDPPPHQGIGARIQGVMQSLNGFFVPVRKTDIFEKESDLDPDSVAERLSDTLADAKWERDKYASKAKWFGIILNIAIGLQVLFGSLTTGLSAVATQGKSAALETTILGALSTIVASYLAQARGSNEPQNSLARVKELKQFIRECKNFIKDHGKDTTSKYDARIDAYRKRFEHLLGNNSGERKQSSSTSNLSESDLGKKYGS